MNRYGLLVLAVALLAYFPCTYASADNISYLQTYWNENRINVVFVNLQSPDLKVTAAVAKRGPGSSEPFQSMISRVHPSAAITGTFFCTRSLRPTGDIVIDGKLVNTGSVGTAVCITYDNQIDFIPLKRLRNIGWKGYETVLCAGPTLIRGGAIALSPKAEGFYDSGIYCKKRRAALGVTQNNKLMLVTVDKPIYLRTLAKIMLHLGAKDAVNLDGGSSAALYCNGKVISSPGRKLTNLIVVYDSIESYLAHRHALAPGLEKPSLEAETIALKPYSQGSTAPAPTKTKPHASALDDIMPKTSLLLPATKHDGYFITTSKP
ncbi:MAG: phosphodiester glycosidase family protein [Armatimonadetes bacterium]|nr:phosphodiester glycosidase family protein [Armatimonadota bacterium]